VSVYRTFVSFRTWTGTRNPTLIPDGDRHRSGRPAPHPTQFGDRWGTGTFPPHGSIGLVPGSLIPRIPGLSREPRAPGQSACPLQRWEQPVGV